MVAGASTAFLCNEKGATFCEWQINEIGGAWGPDDDEAARPALQTFKWERNKSLVLFGPLLFGSVMAAS